MRHGLAELKLGNNEAAYKAFTKAWEFDQQPTIALTLAEVEMELGLYKDAADHWLFFLKEATPDNPERPNAHNQLAECRRHLARAKVVVNVEGTEVILDDKFAGRAPLRDDLWLAPGEHTISIRSNQGAAQAQKMTVAAGESRTIEFNVERPRASAPTVPAPIAPASLSSPTPDSPAAPTPIASEPREPSSARVPVVIAGSILTAVAAGAGVFFTVQSNNASSDADKYRAAVDRASASGDPSQCSDPIGVRPPACGDLEDAVADQKSAHDLAVGSFIAAGALGLGTVAALLFWPTNGEQRRGQASAKLQIGLWSSPQGQGVQARLGF
jgi:hypothetical protein